MDPQQLVIPEWLLTSIGRQFVLAEAQRVQDAATIAALREDVHRLAPLPVAEPNGAAREAVGAVED